MQAQPRCHLSHECGQTLAKVVHINISIMSIPNTNKSLGWIHDHQLNKRARELTVRTQEVICPIHIPHDNTIYPSNMTIQEVVTCFTTVIGMYMIARSQILPVPKLSSPQIEHIPATIKFPKHFHPVGTWNMVFLCQIYMTFKNLANQDFNILPQRT